MALQFLLLALFPICLNQYFHIHSFEQNFPKIDVTLHGPFIALLFTL